LTIPLALPKSILLGASAYLPKGKCGAESTQALFDHAAGLAEIHFAGGRVLTCPKENAGQNQPRRCLTMPLALPKSILLGGKCLRAQRKMRGRINPGAV